MSHCHCPHPTPTALTPNLPSGNFTEVNRNENEGMCYFRWCQSIALETGGYHGKYDIV